MKISGFTIARNAIKYRYPILESIKSILPIVDEFIINIGDSEDDTLALISSLRHPKVRIIENTWDMSMGKEVLSHQTNLALAACRGDWAFYLQSDEVIHEIDLKRLQKAMRRNLKNEKVDALRLRWFHFYGSYFRYRIDRGWYQKQDRIIRNNGQIISCGDAFGFKRRDEQPLRSVMTKSFLYHYGWVQPQDIMANRRKNAEDIGFVTRTKEEKRDQYNYGDLSRFPAYFGSHPAVMQHLIDKHPLSQQDQSTIARKFWWYPPQILGIRYKTGRRVKEKIQ